MTTKRRISIRRSLMTNFVWVILLLGGAVLATTTWGVRKAVQTLSRSVITQTIQQTKSQLRGFFDPVVEELQLASEWGRQGLLDPTDVDRMNKIFMPMIRHHPQVSSILLADWRGREYLLLRTGGRWINRETRIREWGDHSRLTEWVAERSRSIVSWKELHYNPHKRPWYLGAVQNLNPGNTFIGRSIQATPHWTEPYTFFTTKEPGMTCSVAFEAPDGSQFVLAFDVLLKDITKYTMDLEVSEHGKVAILSGDTFRMIGLPRDDRFSGEVVREDALLATPREVGIPAVNDLMGVHRQNNSGETQMYRFTSSRDVWWGGVSAIPLSKNRLLYAAVVVPEKDFLDQLQRMQVWIVVMTLAALGAAIINIGFVAGRYSRRIEALVAQSNRISKGDLETGSPIRSRVEEFYRLAQAHERMRAGLRNLLRLERDIQLARQIQRDTFPKQLPRLNDYRIAAWNQPAEGAAGDTYDVIGLRSSRVGGPRQITAGKAEAAVFLLADAAGHGIGPALSASEARAMLRMAVRMGCDLPAIVRDMNAQLCADLSDGRFVTAWIGQLDASEHRLTCYSAGQAPLFHFDARDGICHVSSANMLPMGVTEEAKIESPRLILMNPGDLYVVLSDGMLEALDADGRLFGKERVIEVIQANHATDPHTLLLKLIDEIDAFTGSRPPDDDRTALIIKREELGPAGCRI